MSHVHNSMNTYHLKHASMQRNLQIRIVHMSEFWIYFQESGQEFKPTLPPLAFSLFRLTWWPSAVLLLPP